MSVCINFLCNNAQNQNDNLFCTFCGSELLLQGQYRVEKKIGGGGFGDIYELSGGDQPKILKVLTEYSEKSIELFLREAKVLQSINHPGIPKVDSNFIFYANNNPQAIYCMILEKIPGINLVQYIEQRNYRPIDEVIARKWLLEIAEILEIIHNQNLLHRDIKPSNIMLKPSGNLVLIDFGAVKEQKPSSSSVSQSKGTIIYSAVYASQEQMFGRAVPQSDVYALGRTMIFLLTGKELNSQDMYNPLDGSLNWREYASSLSNDFADLIDQMIASSVKDRIQSAKDLIIYLERSKDNISTKTFNSDISSSMQQVSPKYLKKTASDFKKEENKSNSKEKIRDSIQKELGDYFDDVSGLIMMSGLVVGFLFEWTDLLGYESDYIFESVLAGFLGTVSVCHSIEEALIDLVYEKLYIFKKKNFYLHSLNNAKMVIFQKVILNCPINMIVMSTIYLFCLLILELFTSGSFKLNDTREAFSSLFYCFILNYILGFILMFLEVLFAKVHIVQKENLIRLLEE